MGLAEDIFKALGVLPSKKSRGGSPFPTPPDPSEVKKSVEKIVEGLSELKDVPQAVISRVVEADKDFREADRALRGARFRGKKKL